MAINTALLVAAPVLQDCLFDDATGLPLANGTIYLYRDNSRTTFKNWYYQSGAPGAYTYITLPNPLTLNATGAISDPNGNDTIPFFYPYSEVDNVTPQPYYIQVYNSNGQQKFVRQNFPFIATMQPSSETGTTLKNYIVNNGFWRNVGSINSGTLTNNPLYNQAGLFSTVIAPGANDGFSMPDIIYFKNSSSSASESITFAKFANGSFLSSDNPPNQDVTPEYYLNVTVTAAASETSRYIQIPVQLHVKNLESTQATFTIWAQNGTGNPNNQISIQLLQFLGTGVVSPAAATLQTLTLPFAWTKFTIPFTFPPIGNAAVGNGADDAWYIQIQLPAGSGITSNINIAKPSLYIGNVVPNNDFTSYNDMTPIINGNRTGDIRSSLSYFVPYGWVVLDDSTIGSPSSGATNRASTDVFALYNLLWNKVNNTFAPVGGGRGASSYADFNANKLMTLTSALGKVLIGLAPGIACTYDRTTTPSWNQTDYPGAPSAQAGLFTLSGGANNTIVYPGAPIYLTGTVPTGGNFSANTIYYAIPDPTTILSSGNTFQLANSYLNAINANAIPAGGASDNGSGLFINFALGGNFGQATHFPNLAELAIHNHPPLNTTFSAYQMLGGTGLSGEGGGGQAATTGDTGNNNYFNLVQPSLYVNIFIKL